MNLPPSKPVLARCAAACEACAQLCEKVAADESITRPLSPEHAALVSCAEVCRVTATAIWDGRTGLPEICTWCADVCESCVENLRAAFERSRVPEICIQCAARYREVSASANPKS